MPSSAYKDVTPADRLLTALKEKFQSERVFLENIKIHLIQAQEAPKLIAFESPVASGQNAFERQIHLNTGELLEWLFTFASTLHTVIKRNDRQRRGCSRFGLRPPHQDPTTRHRRPLRAGPRRRIPKAEKPQTSRSIPIRQSIGSPSQGAIEANAETPEAEPAAA